MAVRIESAPNGVPHRRTRFPKGLIRHASAPARPQMRLDYAASGERPRGIRRQASNLSSANRPRPTPQPLNELAIAESIVSRLRPECDEWKLAAQLHEHQLLSNETNVRRQEQCITVLEEQNSTLRTRHKEDESRINQMSARLRETTIEHDRLVFDLDDAKRAAARLKRSDRAKGKVVQRNLRLKATLQRYTSEASVEPDADMETALKEALAAAQERIEELESKGKDLLEVLQHNDSPDGEEWSVDAGQKTQQMRAEIALREVIEDEDFKEEKDHWQNLMEE